MTEVTSTPFKRNHSGSQLNGSISEGSSKMYKRDPAHRYLVKLFCCKLIIRSLLYAGS